MLHQEIIEDPDVAQAIVDLRPVVVELRELSGAIAAAGQGSRPRLKPEHRAALEAEVAELTSRIALRAERLALTTDELLVLINDHLAARRQCGHADRGLSTTLLDTLMAAREREAAAHVALTAAQLEVRAASDARTDAERSYIAYAAGRG